MAAKWRYGTPVVMSEHGIYLRERYLAVSRREDDAARGAGADAQLLPIAGRGRLPHLRRAGAALELQPALAAAERRRPRSHVDDVQRRRSPTTSRSPSPSPTGPTIVFMGRIDPLKDLHTLIRAFALVRAEVPERAAAHLRRHAAGGPSRTSDSCRRLIDELGLTGCGRAGGPGRHLRSTPTTPAASSRSPASPRAFPYTVVEAMACGRPIVCTNVGGVAEAVGDAGIVVPPRDHVAVAARLRQAAARRRAAPPPGDAARPRVLSSSPSATRSRRTGRSTSTLDRRCRVGTAHGRGGRPRSSGPAGTAVAAAPAVAASHGRAGLAGRPAPDRRPGPRRARRPADDVRGADHAPARVAAATRRSSHADLAAAGPARRLRFDPFDDLVDRVRAGGRGVGRRAAGRGRAGGRRPHRPGGPGRVRLRRRLRAGRGGVPAGRHRLQRPGAARPRPAPAGPRSCATSPWRAVPVAGGRFPAALAGWAATGWWPASCSPPAIGWVWSRAAAWLAYQLLGTGPARVGRPVARGGRR